ncbi:MAG TPA: hypothetical protein GXX38_03355 [Clostridia bacterium]|jgi:nitroreductase|nr:hypothetical protein [Clostridia bacterium]
MLELLLKRRSIRRFKDTSLPADKIEQLLKAALLSPSSRNICPWEFIVVDDKELLKKLSQAKEHSASFLAGAPLGIVVIADQNKSDVWVEDCSIVSIIIQLMAESLGLGSCWIQIRNRMYSSAKTAEEYIRELLNIPANYGVESIIALGYPDEKKEPHREEDLQFNKVYLNGYNFPYK